MSYNITPTVFSHNKKEFEERLSRLRKISKNLQIDIMDGKFVKAKSIQISQIPNLKRYNNSFEVHLMVKKPSNYIKKLKSKGFKKIIFHFNTDDNVAVIAQIKKAKMQAFLALNPEDKVDNASYLFQLVDGILLMGHVPGKEHLGLVSSTFGKIKSIRKIDKNIKIQIDGGVNAKDIRKLAKLGVNIFNTGSFVADAQNPRKALAILKKG